MLLIFVLILFYISIGIKTSFGLQKILTYAKSTLGDAKKTSMNVSNGNRNDGNQCKYLNIEYFWKNNIHFPSNINFNIWTCEKTSSNRWMTNRWNDEWTGKYLLLNVYTLIFLSINPASKNKCKWKNEKSTYEKKKQ